MQAVASEELRQRDAERRSSEQDRLVADKLQEIAALSAKRDMLTQKFSAHLEELKSGGAESAELEFAKAELEREQKVFELIAARKLALQTEMRAPARVSLMQGATVPTIPIEPIPYKLMFLACVLALAGSVRLRDGSRGDHSPCHQRRTTEVGADVAIARRGGSLSGTACVIGTTRFHGEPSA